MSGPTRLEAHTIDEALLTLLDRYPDARITGLDPDGLHVPLPPEFPLGDHELIGTRTGLEVVSAPHRRPLMQQFLELEDVGASSLDVETPDGRPATYYMFDCASTYGIRVAVLVEEATEGDTRLDLPEASPVRPRYGRIWRSMYSEVLRIDEAIPAMYGHTLDDYRAREASDFIHPDDQQAARTNWFDVIASPHGTARRWRARVERGDGTWMWTEITNTNHLDDPDDPHVLSEMVDISEEMAVVDELWQSRELLRRLTDAMPVGVCQFDASGALEYVNDRMYELLDVGTGADLFEQVSRVDRKDAPKLIEAVSTVLAGGPDTDIELRFHPAGGPPKYLHMALRAVRDRDDAVTGAIVAVSDITESATLRSELERRATYDALTGCYNRAAILTEIERALSCGSDAATGTAVVYSDLDGFKAINDRDGHAAGDAVLRVAAGRLRGAVRDADLVGRMGGDEFVVLCPDIGSPELAMDVGRRIARTVAGSVRVGDAQESIAVSVGVAWCGSAGVDADALVAAADEAMYEAKRSGTDEPVLAALVDG